MPSEIFNSWLEEQKARGKMPWTRADAKNLNKMLAEKDEKSNAKTEVVPKIETGTRPEIFEDASTAHKKDTTTATFSPIDTHKVYNPKDFGIKDISIKSPVNDHLKNDLGYNLKDEDLDNLTNNAKFDTFLGHVEKHHSDGYHDATTGFGPHPHCPSCFREKALNA